MRGFYFEFAGFLGDFFGHPIAQMEVLFDFPPFVAVFMGLFGLVFGFSEGMFAVTYGFGNHVQRFSHNPAFLSQVYTSVYHANPGYPVELRRLPRLTLIDRGNYQPF
jgi:hypothetical protein